MILQLVLGAGVAGLVTTGLVLFKKGMCEIKQAKILGGFNTPQAFEEHQKHMKKAIVWHELSNTAFFVASLVLLILLATLF